MKAIQKQMTLLYGTNPAVHHKYGGKSSNFF